MNKINVSFIKLKETAVLPKSAHETDSGYDLTAIESVKIPARGSALVDTGLQVAYIDPSIWFHIAPRSGLGFKFGIQPHLGTIDSGYRGSLGVKLYNLSDTDYEVKAGDRIAQIIFYPLVKPIVTWADNIDQTVRGDTGFGTSGR